MLEGENKIRRKQLVQLILTEYLNYQSEIAQSEWGPEDCWRKGF